MKSENPLAVRSDLLPWLSTFLEHARPAIEYLLGDLAALSVPQPEQETFLNVLVGITTMNKQEMVDGAEELIFGSFYSDKSRRKNKRRLSALRQLAKGLEKDGRTYSAALICHVAEVNACFETDRNFFRGLDYGNNGKRQRADSKPHIDSYVLQIDNLMERVFGRSLDGVDLYGEASLYAVLVSALVSPDAKKKWSNYTTDRMLRYLRHGREDKKRGVKTEPVKTESTMYAFMQFKNPEMRLFARVKPFLNTELAARAILRAASGDIRFDSLDAGERERKIELFEAAQGLVRRLSAHRRERALARKKTRGSPTSAT